MINSIILPGLYLKWVKNIGGSDQRFIFSKLVGSNKNNIFELCPKERLDMMREVNKCQNKCKLDSSHEPLVRLGCPRKLGTVRDGPGNYGQKALTRTPQVRPIIRSMSRKITKLGASFEKCSPKRSKYLPKKKRESTRLIERRKSTLQPSTSRCSKIRKVINLILIEEFFLSI